MRWTSGLAQRLPSLAGIDGGGATAISADGSVIGGYQIIALATVPVLWTSAGVQRLEHPYVVNGANPDWPLNVSVRALSADGTIAVGAAGGSPSLRWVGTSAPEQLGFAESNDAFALAISGDGRVVVGGARFSERGGEFVRWEGTQAAALEAFAPDATAGALAVNADGSLVAGQAASSLRGYTRNLGAMLWDAEHGLRRLQDVLALSGADLTYWQLDSVSGMSSDGKVLVGQGTCGSRPMAFLARLP